MNCLKIKYYEIAVESEKIEFLNTLNKINSTLQDKNGELIIQKVESDWDVSYYYIKAYIPDAINENFLNTIPMLCKIKEFKEKKIYSFFANLFKRKENNNENNI